MNGVHDLGGFQCFGSVRVEADERVFHAEWERRAFALTLAMAAPGGWNLDMSRHARESLPPADYLSNSYYEIWIAALEKLMYERGLVTPEEIAAGRSLRPAKSVPRTLSADQVTAMLAKGGPTERPPSKPSRFGVGDTVRALNLNPTGHTRLPRYVRNHIGTIVHVHGCHVFPDAHAHGLGEQPQWLYGTDFSAREIWGPEGKAGDQVHVDLWESYLEPA